MFWLLQSLTPNLLDVIMHMSHFGLQEPLFVQWSYVPWFVLTSVFNKYLMSSHLLASNILGPGDTAVKMVKIAWYHGAPSSWVRQVLNNNKPQMNIYHNFRWYKRKNCVKRKREVILLVDVGWLGRASLNFPLSWDPNGTKNRDEDV